MAQAALLQDDLDCAACGGHRTFAPDRQALVCGHCGDATAIESRIDKADDEICLTKADDRQSLELGSSPSL
jgi:hypothetical protein